MYTYTYSGVHEMSLAPFTTEQLHYLMQSAPWRSSYSLWR